MLYAKAVEADPPLINCFAGGDEQVAVDFRPERSQLAEICNG